MLMSENLEDGWILFTVEPIVTMTICITAIGGNFRLAHIETMFGF